MSDPRVLFLANPAADYVGDGLFHGLRSLIGASVVDWPRRDLMYRGAVIAEDYGRGFGLYGLLPDIAVNRSDVFEREWDLVVSAVMWRDWAWWERAWTAFGSGPRHAVVDGGDLPWIYPYGPSWWRPGRWFVPRAHCRATYFKREWGWVSMLAAGRRIHLEPIAIAYPAEKILRAVPVKSKQFPEHIVDLEVGERLGRRLAHGRVHIFEREADYLTDLRASRYGITTKRAGWDALRHSELAAAGAVPCFRNLAEKPATCAPYGLIPGVNCVAYRGADDLLTQIEATSDGRREELAAEALHWARGNSTEAWAIRFLESAL